MGFNYEPLKALDASRHKFMGGNHDNYDNYYNCKHAMSDFGCYAHRHFTHGWIRGGFSVDKHWRVKNEVLGGLKTWWEEEELGQRDGKQAIAQYALGKPDVMLSHSCPTEIAQLIGNPGTLRNFGFNPNTFRTSTQELLQQCFDEYKPRLWVFGHFHMSRIVKVKGTTFVCLPELGYLDLDYKYGEIVK
jgi:hypothetical protein